jgi:hypothetical protein
MVKNLFNFGVFGVPIWAWRRDIVAHYFLKARSFILPHMFNSQIILCLDPAYPKIVEMAFETEVNISQPTDHSY